MSSRFSGLLTEEPPKVTFKTSSRFSGLLQETKRPEEETRPKDAFDSLGAEAPYAESSEINPLTGKPRKVFEAPTEYLRTKEVPEVLGIPSPGGGGRFRGAGATASWEEPSLIDKALTKTWSLEQRMRQAGKQIPKGLARGTETLVGTVGSMARWAAERAKIGDVVTKHVNIPGAGVVAEYLVRKFGPKQPTEFFDKQMKKYAKQGEKWADFWEEQAQKGWEAPDPEVTQAKWRDKPLVKGAATISEAAPNYLAAIAASILTKSPQTGLLFISGLSGAGQYRRQRKKGAGVAKANAIAAMTGAWEYVTELVPFTEVFKPAKSTFLKMLKLGTMESAQEFIQGIGENFLEYFGYKAKDLKSVPAAVREGLKHTMDGWVENIVAGFGLGVMGGGIMPKAGLARPVETPPTEGAQAPEQAVQPRTTLKGVELPLPARDKRGQAPAVEVAGEKKAAIRGLKPEDISEGIVTDRAVGLPQQDKKPRTEPESLKAAAKLETTKGQTASQVEIAKKWKNQKTTSFRANVEASRAINRYKGIRVVADKGKPPKVQSLNEIQSLIDNAVQEHEKLVDVAKQMEKEGFPTGDVAMHSADGLESIRRQTRGMQLKTPETPAGYYLKTTTTEAQPVAKAEGKSSKEIAEQAPKMTEDEFVEATEKFYSAPEAKRVHKKLIKEAEPAKKVEKKVEAEGEFATYKKAMPNATEQEVVVAMVEDGIRPPAEMLKKYEDVPVIERILEQDEIDKAVKRAAQAQPKKLAEKIPPRPLVNPKASALQRDKQLKRQQAWDKKYGKLKAEQVKPTGKIGFPKGVEEIELPAEAIGKEPVSARQIIESLSKSLKVPYVNMATHRRRAAAGWYEVRPIGIRQINVRDLGTAAHEAGHHIDYFWKIRRAGISKIGRKTWRMPEGTAKGTAAELTRLGKMLYGEKKPKGGYRAEGVAEFVRGYLTGHLDIQKEAPKFYKWFIKDYLPNNPEVAIGLLNARAMLTDYRLQGAEARIESQISRKEIKRAMADRIRGGNLWLQTMFIDEFAPLRAILEEKKLRTAGIERLKQPLKPEEDPYELAVYFSQKEGARARAMVLFGTIDLWGNKTGKGLKEIMKPIADQNAVRPFTHYMFAAEALHRWKQGKNPGISKADAQYVYDLYKDNKGWKETFKEVTDWNHRVLDYLRQAGQMTDELYNKILEQNPIYIPLLRAFVKGEKRFGGGGAGRGLITTKKGVFSMKGSGREIIEPFESMIVQTRRMLSIAHKSVIARALADLEAKHRGLADFIWKVPAPKKATTFRAEQAIKQLQKMGTDVTGADADALMTVYSNSPIYLGKENIIAIVQNGKKSWYEVSPEMYRLLQGLDKFYLPRFLNITLGKAGRAVRLGATGINASFGLVRNPIRDSLDTIFKGTHARGPLASVKGVAKDLSRMGLTKSLGIDPSKAAEEFVSMGGQISGFVGQDRKSLQHLKGEMLASNIGRYSIHTVKHPIDALREVFGVAESGPRIQEYEKALIVGEKKYGKGSPSAKIYAFNKAQDQTINYSRHGVIGKWLNSMIPFWNANAQDPSKVYRTFRARGKEATAYAIAFMTLPALGLWWYNKDEEWYKELPAYETANYLHIKMPGKDVILRIPVPFLVGHIFQSTPVVMMDALYRADPKRIKEHFEQVLKGDVYPLAEWPAAVAPIIDVLQNKDWAGRPIVPKGVEGKLPSDQYKEYTTEFCKNIGKIFKQSPAKIEYLINAYSGGLYRRTGRIAGIITKAPEETQPADWPVIGAIIVRDPYAPKRSIERFYERSDLLDRKFQSEKITRAEKIERLKLNRRRRKLTPIWKQLQTTKKIDNRKILYKRIEKIIKGTPSG